MSLKRGMYVCMLQAKQLEVYDRPMSNNKYPTLGSDIMMSGMYLSNEVRVDWCGFQNQGLLSPSVKV